jgi:hypothetical protein
MRWKLAILILRLFVVFFIATKNSTENFEQEKQAIELASDKGTAQYLAGQIAFDAYNAVHGKPPPSEALDHYRKIAQAEQLDKTKMIARITSDKVTLPEADKPTAIKVDDADVDAELLRLKDHAVTAEALQYIDGRSPVSIRGTTHYYTNRACNCTADCVSLTQVVDPNMALKLQELSAQIAAISQQLNNGSGALSTVQPASIERFYTL